MDIADEEIDDEKRGIIPTTVPRRIYHEVGTLGFAREQMELLKREVWKDKGSREMEIGEITKYIVCLYQPFTVSMYNKSSVIAKYLNCPCGTFYGPHYIIICTKKKNGSANFSEKTTAGPPKALNPPSILWSLVAPAYGTE